MKCSICGKGYSYSKTDKEYNSGVCPECKAAQGKKKNVPFKSEVKVDDEPKQFKSSGFEGKK